MLKTQVEWLEPVPITVPERVWPQCWAWGVACAGLAQRLASRDGMMRLVLTTNLDLNQTETLKQWRAAAEASWLAANHTNWIIVPENSVG